MILDLGIGNLSNVQKVTGGKVTHDTDDISRAEKIILPGVGNFGEIMRSLQSVKNDIIDAAKEDKYILGICLGMQLFFDTSEEGKGEGLGLIDGVVSRFKGVRTPHIGWNRLFIERECPLLRGITDESYFYFVHSYFVEPEDTNCVAGTTVYGKKFTVRFPSVIWNDNVFGVQFHPEKSSAVGLRLLKNFKELST